MCRVDGAPWSYLVYLIKALVSAQQMFDCNSKKKKNKAIVFKKRNSFEWNFCSRE